jgi:hypothetical protein
MAFFSAVEVLCVTYSLKTVLFTKKYIENLDRRIIMVRSYQNKR